MRNNEKKLPKRSEISSQFKWKLEDIYPDVESWEKDFEKVRKMSEEVGKFRGTLVKSSDNLLKCLEFCDEMYSINDKVYVYAKMRRDEDNSNTTYQALTDRATSLMTDVYSATSFIVPEIISIPEETVRKFIETNPGLSTYKHYLEENMRMKEHILSDKEEQLLAMAAEMSGTAKEAFTMLNNADLKFPVIKDENGNDIELTKGRYIQLMENQNRQVRKDAFMALYHTYGKFINTISSLLSSNIKKNIFYSKVRKYPSALEASLDSDNISRKVYEQLIDTVSARLDLLHRYVELRKKALAVDELHMYDLYVPIVKDVEMKVTYPEAVEMVKKALAPLGEQYVKDLTDGLNSGWVDVYENEGKTSGAYSWGAYLTHPYVLMNYQDTINDVFTLAHEMGHAMHTYYSNKNQPYINAEYRIFVAEVASTVNENILMEYLLKNTDDRQKQAYLVNHYLEEFRGTVFRQTMFAEFEKIVHEMAESGEALTPEVFNKVYHDLNVQYYGPNIVVDPEIDLEWARIPHFYNSFYVYKYATGFSAATALSNAILNEGKKAADRYLEFLGSGGSDYPLELLKKAGVDMTTSGPVEDSLNVFEKYLDRMEELINNK